MQTKDAVLRDLRARQEDPPEPLGQLGEPEILDPLAQEGFLALRQILAQQV